ncbi:putative membrane protein YgcG [Tepidibacillus fermentans]|uniref:Putative membrane protein YgcG n=1 Tax=Tepidibacillus fermentans TaxID=1281767 RepID=A0A4R3KDB5_9BACI|nr:putative membrane protein YgcG [Tepidibacillus fermentans]
MIRLEFIILFVMTLFFLSHSVFAEEQLQKSMIEDDANYLSKEKKESIEKEMQHLPEVFRIVFLPKIDSAIDIKGKELFTEKQLPEDTILILAVVDQRKIQIITGEALQKKGLDDTFFQKEIEQYFVPGVKTGAMDQAFIQLTKGISKDIAAGIKVQDKKEKDSPKIPMPPQQVQGSKGKGEEWYPKYLWSIGLLLIAAMIWLIAKTRKKSS